MLDESFGNVDELEYASVARPCFGELVSGDAAIVHSRNGIVFLAIVDALGHGPNANDIAVQIRTFLDAEWQEDVVSTLLGLHEAIRGSIGAAVGLASLDLASGKLRYTGVGNTVIRKFGTRSIRLPSTEGVVGSRMRSPREQKLQLDETEVLTFYSDGIKDRFELSEYPQLIYESSRSVARKIVRNYGKQYDDATCLVVRYRK
ncbi:MAG: SpoIIE family protein phosphatase [Anaerolineaceae bacterium]|nr:MAG: SpoIIE family protein phosphatase [Anaerolineaceae bacterium]